jgi:23S rRNA (cytosine1962-C5)-methyltransferase
MKPYESVIARLKPRRERPAANGHPWIFSGAIARWEGEPRVGSVADVVSHDGRWLGRGLAHPGADLAVRLYAWREQESLDEALFTRRVESAIAVRERLLDGEATNACRLVFSESDGLSGLIVDRYAQVLAVKVGAAALVPFMPEILSFLLKRTGAQHLLVSAEKDDVAREGLDAAALAALSTPGPSSVEIREHGFRFEVDLAGGQKTGFYLDQRDNRARVAAYARGRRVLSAYCYTGAFEVYAGASGAAAITGLDSSGPAIEKARRHLELNRIPVSADYRVADVPDALRRFRDEGRAFDLIILDPPRFVFNAAQKEKGLRAYKDINLLGLKLLSPGGILATFSCSGLVTMEDLKLALRWAAKDSGRYVRILETLGQPPDHPVSATFPEAEYLGGLICHAS